MTTFEEFKFGVGTFGGPKMVLQLWNELAPRGVAELSELIDGLRRRGFPEGSWDGMIEAIETLPCVATDEDMVFREMARGGGQ